MFLIFMSPSHTLKRLLSLSVSESHIDLSLSLFPSFPFRSLFHWLWFLVPHNQNHVFRSLFPFRYERVSSLPWLQSASSRSSRTCKKTHQLLAALVPLLQPLRSFPIKFYYFHFQSLIYCHYFPLFKTSSFHLLVFPQSKQKLPHFASSCEQVTPNPKSKT